MECAICFDPLLESERLPLPCRCTVPYCLGCWDRALASSFNRARGDTQRHLMRSAVRVRGGQHLSCLSRAQCCVLRNMLFRF